MHILSDVKHFRRNRPPIPPNTNVSPEDWNLHVTTPRGGELKFYCNIMLTSCNMCSLTSLFIPFFRSANMSKHNMSTFQNILCRKANIGINQAQYVCIWLESCEIERNIKGIRDAGSTPDFRILFEILKSKNLKIWKFGKFWNLLKN